MRLPTCLRLVRPWLPVAVVVGLLYLLISAAHPRALAASARTFHWLLLLPLAGSYILFVIFRAVRWHLLLRSTGAPNSVWDSVLLFWAAQAAVLVPAGQLLLPVLQKRRHGTLIRRSAATVLVQELLFGLLILPAALPAIQHYPLAGWLLLAAFGISAGAVTLVLNDGLANAGIFCANLVPALRGHVRSFRDLRHHIVRLVTTPEALLGSLLDLAAIAAGGTGLFIVLAGLGLAHTGWIVAIASYALGTAAATLSALPGGLGANEDIGTAVLSHMGVAAGPAAAGMLIFRAVTLIGGTLVGLAVLLLLKRHLRGGLSFSLGGLRAEAAAAEFAA
ncbi:MAG: lysylphosphatidylglycerol synthase transmembrane domain-containing protein [Chloroflexota bacterium]